MSKTVIIVLVLVALGLGGTLLLINQQPRKQGGSASTTTPTGPAFEIDPAEVRALSVTDAGGITRTVFKTRDNNWFYAELPVTAEPDAGWPVDATRVSTAIRTLAKIPAVGEAENTSIDDAAPTIGLRLTDGSTRSIQVEQDSVGGNTLALIDGQRLALISADTVSGVLDEGPAQWRTRSPLAGLSADASRLTVSAGEQRVALAKVDNRWIMRSPVSARADEAVIRTVVDAILKMRIRDFADAPQGVHQPVVTIEIERDEALRDDGSARSVLTRQLVIGPPTDGGGAARRASLRGSNLPPTTALILERAEIVTDQQFAALARPEAYLSKIAVPERPGDIGIVLVRPLGEGDGDRGFRRDLDGWNEMRPDGGMRAAELPDREALTQILALLGEQPGIPLIAADVEGFRPLTRLELYTLDDSDLGTLQAGYVDQTLAVRRANVVWLYPEATASPLLMLPAPEDVEPEPEREPDTADESDAADNK